ncbi:MAG: glycosyltransferase family 4 protein [Colwellia sp.]|nr:glycosyltransferase family 4 protein [Colwellia sp.]
MRTIWIIRNSESLITDSSGARLWRTGIFVKFFYNKGINVRWFVSSFDHYNKCSRSSEVFKDKMQKDTLQVLKTIGYSSNVSIRRFFDHFQFGVKAFFRFFRNEKPSVILVSYPTPESAFFSVLYGKLKNVPVIVDVRDLWPEVFYEDKGYLKTLLLKLFTLPYIFMKYYSLKNATSVIAVNNNFLTWSQKNRSDIKKSLDLTLYIPFERPEIRISDELFFDFIDKFSSHKAFEEKKIVTFGGTLGKMFDFSPLKEALSLGRFQDTLFFICGDGDSRDELVSSFSEYSNVIFPGYIDSGLLYHLLCNSDLLLAPYKKINNFNGHLPNKFMEYISTGKPIISSLDGEAARLLEDYNCGFTYNSSDSFMEVLSDALISQDRLQSMGLNSLKLYDKFSPEVILHELEKHINKVCKS